MWNITSTKFWENRFEVTRKGYERIFFNMKENEIKKIIRKRFWENIWAQRHVITGQGEN
jgi:hypothetical protein